MPAKAQTSDYMSAHEEKVWDNGYVFGYEYGVLTTTCVHYHLCSLPPVFTTTLAIYLGTT